jgi:hypothetical protein
MEYHHKIINPATFLKHYWAEYSDSQSLSMDIPCYIPFKPHASFNFDPALSVVPKKMSRDVLLCMHQHIYHS